MTAPRAGATVATALAVTLAVGCSGSPASSDEPQSTTSATTSSSPAGSASPTPLATKGALQITRAYLPKPPLKDIAALYFTVRNTGAHPDHLDRVAVPGLSSDVTTHTTRGDGMVRVDGYRVPAHGRLVLRRGGNHVMLMDLSRMPTRGSTVRAQLFFNHAGRIDITVPVVAQTYRPA